MLGIHGLLGLSPQEGRYGSVGNQLPFFYNVFKVDLFSNSFHV
jgi:hypothetical protein